MPGSATSHTRWVAASFPAVCLLCALAVFFIDQPLLLWVQALPESLKDWFGDITDLAKAEMFLVPAAGVFLSFKGLATLNRDNAALRDRLTRIANAGLFVFAAVALSGILINVLKILFGRYRPYQFLTEGLYGFDLLCVGGACSSFPSGHSQVAWSGMTALALLFPRLWPLAIPVAVVLSASRVLTSNHYVGDVLMGAYLGAVMTVLLYDGLRDRIRLPGGRVSDRSAGVSPSVKSIHINSQPLDSHEQRQ